MDSMLGEDFAGLEVGGDEEGVPEGAEVDDVVVEIELWSGSTDWIVCDGGLERVRGPVVEDHLGAVDVPLDFAGGVVEGYEGAVPGREIGDSVGDGRRCGYATTIAGDVAVLSDGLDVGRRYLGISRSPAIVVAAATPADPWGFFGLVVCGREGQKRSD